MNAFLSVLSMNLVFVLNQTYPSQSFDHILDEIINICTEASSKERFGHVLFQPGFNFRNSQTTH